VKKIVSGIYQISPLEGFQINVSGPMDPIAALDGKTLAIQEGQTFAVTPDMLNGMGASHFLFLDLVFVGDAPGRYNIDILDDGGLQIDRIFKSGPDEPGGDSAQVQIKVRVEADAAMVASMRAAAGARRKKL
jgi:hypothetical protein